MNFNIGMVGASGSGKTSLMTAMFLDMKQHLGACPQTTSSVKILLEDVETKQALRDAKYRFDSCIRMKKFVAWERSAECSHFGFKIVFDHDGKERSFGFRIMDYPRGLLSNRDEFDKTCLPHISKSCALFVPIDAVALVKYDDERAKNSADAEKILSRLEVEKVVEVIKIWAGARSQAERGILFLVPIKTESYFKNSGCCVSEKASRLECLVRELYVNKLREMSAKDVLDVVYNPVDTYGCVSLSLASWKDKDGFLQEEFDVVPNAKLRITGAVDLFSTIIRTTLSNCAEETDRNARQGLADIEKRGMIKRVFYYFFPDPVKQFVEANESAKEFYDAALQQMSEFSSTSRLKVIPLN